MSAGAPRRPVPRRIAHRGASRERPENSLAAFDEALRQRCQAIELDAQLSADGRVYVHHDRTLSKVGGGRRRLRNVDAATLASLGLCSLDRVVRRYAARVELLIEIKAYGDDRGYHRALTEACVEVVRAHDAIERSWILCFDPRVLDLVARLEPRLARVLNLDPPRRLNATLAARLDRLSALSLSIGKITPAFAAAIERAGCPTMTFTCNTPRRLRRAIDRGIDGIMTDRPGWLREQLAEEEP